MDVGPPGVRTCMIIIVASTTIAIYTVQTGKWEYHNVPKYILRIKGNPIRA